MAQSRLKKYTKYLSKLIDSLNTHFEPWPKWMLICNDVFNFSHDLTIAECWYEMLTNEIYFKHCKRPNAFALRFLNCSFLLVMSSKSSLGWGIYHRGWWTISLKMKTSFLEKRKHVTETHKNQHKMIHFDHFFLYFNFSSVCLFLVALNGTSFLSGLPESRLEFQRAWPHRHLWTIFTSCFFCHGTLISIDLSHRDVVGSRQFT